METIKQSLNLEQRIDVLLMQAQGPGDEFCVQTAEAIIKKHDLPYIIIKDENGIWKRQSQYSAGELFLRQFITVDQETIEMKSLAAKMAPTVYEVLISGETGTGKELIAKSQINSRKGLLQSVNCAGFPRELIESELFGYVKGSFTGADRTKDGLIKSAENGIMFMDEIGDLPLDVQAKLLRVLQDKKVRKVGGVNGEDINCKFVFATNRNLRQMVERELFRKDLFARISTLELDIKPLRERKCDIIPIVKSLDGGDKFLERYASLIMDLDLSLNVRSLQQYVIRYNVLGRITIEK